MPDWLKNNMTLEKVFSVVFGIPEANVHDSLELRKIDGWDSMSHMILITRIEEEYQIRLTGDEIADMQSVGDSRRALHSRGLTA